MHEDIALQQPSEGRSGLYKPLFWVDLEMTGELSITATPQEMPGTHRCKYCLMQAQAACVSGSCCLQVHGLSALMMHHCKLQCWAFVILYSTISGKTSADLARRAEVLHLLTGLDLEHDTIIEIACLITDGNLEKTLEVSLLLSASLQICA